MKVRLKDIAKLTDVSVATVSLVLNDPESSRVSKKKRKEILKVAQELKYIPNISARALVTNKTRLIGLIVPDLDNPFFSSLTKSIEIECRKRGYFVMTMNTLEDSNNDVQMIQNLMRLNVDGLIIAMSGNTYSNPEGVRTALNNLSAPFVLVDRTLEDYPANQVVFNNKHGEYLATRHLIEHGHTKIGFISASDTAMTGHYRYLGYVKALEEADIAFNEHFIRYGRYTFQSGYELAESLIDEGVSAIVASNDLIGYGVYRKCRELGLKVPEDISIVGYDNLPLNDFGDVGLTSVHQDTTMLGEKTVSLLFKVISGQEEKTEIVLEPSLKVRNSVAQRK